MMVGEKKQKRIDQIDGRTVLFLTPVSYTHLTLPTILRV